MCNAITEPRSPLMKEVRVDGRSSQLDLCSSMSQITNLPQRSLQSVQLLQHGFDM